MYYNRDVIKVLNESQCMTRFRRSSDQGVEQFFRIFYYYIRCYNFLYASGKQMTKYRELAIFPYPRELFPLFNRLHTHRNYIVIYKYIQYHVQRISTTIRFKESFQKKKVQKVYIVKVYNSFSRSTRGLGKCLPKLLLDHNII